MPKKHCNTHKYHSTTWFQITIWQPAWSSPLLKSFWVVLLVSHLSAGFPLITHCLFSAAFFDPEFLCQPVGSFGDKLLCQCLINFNYSSTWDFLLRKDASGSEMENPSDISQECPLHKNSVTRVWTLNSDLQFREWASHLWDFVVESGVSYL